MSCSRENCLREGGRCDQPQGKAGGQGKASGYGLRDVNTASLTWS